MDKKGHLCFRCNKTGSTFSYDEIPDGVVFSIYDGEEVHAQFITDPVFLKNISLMLLQKWSSLKKKPEIEPRLDEDENYISKDLLFKKRG